MTAATNDLIEILFALEGRVDPDRLSRVGEVARTFGLALASGLVRFRKPDSYFCFPQAPVRVTNEGGHLLPLALWLSEETRLA